MTEAQRELARHALGLPNDRQRSYRNGAKHHHATTDYCEWCAMVSAGEAKRKLDLNPEYTVFVLTLDGARLALLPGESLDPEDFTQ